jgi:hypothetical protein
MSTLPILIQYNRFLAKAIIQKKEIKGISIRERRNQIIPSHSWYVSMFKIP